MWKLHFQWLDQTPQTHDCISEPYLNEHGFLAFVTQDDTHAFIRSSQLQSFRWRKQDEKSA